MCWRSLEITEKCLGSGVTPHFQIQESMSQCVLSKMLSKAFSGLYIAHAHTHTHRHTCTWTLKYKLTLNIHWRFPQIPPHSSVGCCYTVQFSKLPRALTT